MPKPRFRQNPKRLGLAPIVTNPPPSDVRLQPRQLDLGDVGAVQELAPVLPPAVRAALHATARAPYCVQPWCDALATDAGLCAGHSAERARELHSAIDRIRRTPRKSRKVQR